MRIGCGRLIAGAGALFVATVGLQACNSRPAATSAPAPSASPSLEESVTPVLTIKELMEHIIDPTADWVFDAVGVDVNEKGTIETKPVTDEEWLKVERGALMLAEGTNLLKMHRAVAPPGAEGLTVEPGKPAPELPPDQIEAKINANRALWNKYADGLRDVALASLKIAKARDSNALFKAGSDIDAACENCHLEYWYPGDRAAVLADQQKKVTFNPPKKK